MSLSACWRRVQPSRKILEADSTYIDPDIQVKSGKGEGCGSDGDSVLTFSSWHSEELGDGWEHETLSEARNAREIQEEQDPWLVNDNEWTWNKILTWMKRVSNPIRILDVVQ